jgi:hypothetical protein
MENGQERANFWRDFILQNAQYPAPSRLRRQFETARFHDFCNCGCNTFRVTLSDPLVEPLALPRDDLPEGAGAAVYEADFTLPDGKTLEIIIFADRDGHLSEIEVDCCANSYPIPDKIEISGPPFHTHAADRLFTDLGQT